MACLLSRVSIHFLGYFSGRIPVSIPTVASGTWKASGHTVKPDITLSGTLQRLRKLDITMTILVQCVMYQPLMGTLEGTVAAKIILNSNVHHT